MRYDAFAGSGFHVVLHGQAWLVTTDHPPRALHQGDVVLTPYGAEHGLSHVPCALGDLPPGEMSAQPPPAGPADFEFLCGAYRLSHGQVHEYLAALPDFIMGSPEDGDCELASLTSLLVADLSETRPATEVTRSALLDLLLTHVLRRWLSDNRLEVWPHVDDPVVTAALRRIHQDPRRPWTVSELSTAAGMSRTAFTRRFTRLLGKPPRDYLSGVRLTQAAQLLRETNLPLATVARQVGYSTEFAFGGAFRRAYGISPGRFRVTMDSGPVNAVSAAPPGRLASRTP